MRRNEKAVTAQAELEAILEKSLVLHLGLCRDNEPYVVPLTYAYHDGRIYFHCARKGRKLDMIRANPRVCFQVECDVEVVPADKPEKACAWTMHFRSVIGWGRAEIIEEPDALHEGLSLFMSRFSEPPHSFSDKALAQTALVVVHVEEMSGKQSPAPGNG